MKRITLAFFVCAFCILLGSCAGWERGEAFLSVPAFPIGSGKETQAESQAPGYTAEDAYRAFSEDQNFKNCDPLDCVLADDNSSGLAAVVWYLDRDRDNECNLAFVRTDTIYPLCFAVSSQEGKKEFQAAGGMKYLGGGAVSLSVKNRETGQALVYTVQYEYSEKDHAPYTNFTIRSEEANA